MKKLIVILLIFAVLSALSGGWGLLGTWAVLFIIPVIIIPLNIIFGNRERKKTDSELVVDQPTILKEDTKAHPAIRAFFLITLLGLVLALMYIILFLEGKDRDMPLGYLWYGSIAYGIFAVMTYFFIKMWDS